jgi:paraquat-inducible protein B
LVDSAREAVSELHRLIGSPDLKLTIRSLGDIAGRVGEAAGNVSQLATGLDTSVSKLTANLGQTSGKAGAMMDRADLVLQHTDAAFNEAPVVYQLTRTLEEVAAAARSVRQLTGYLERNPSSVIFGKPVAQGK